MSRRNDRAARVAVPVRLVTAGPDLGADGPAALARRFLQMSTDVAGVFARQIVEAGPLHGVRLDQRQMDAAASLSRLWWDAMPGACGPMGYGGFKGGGTRALSPEQEAAAGAAARGYRKALDACQWAAGVRGVIAVECAIIHHEAGHHMEHLPRALTALADYFQHN